ncbi:hypothetical protein ABQE62_05995 [Mycolicibacterium fortuitum]
MSARVRIAARAFRDWLSDPATVVTGVILVVALSGWLLFAPPRADVAGPPAEIATAKVGGYCVIVVTGFDGGAAWALAPGSRDGDLKRVDAVDVDRDAVECKSVATPGAGSRSGR